MTAQTIALLGGVVVLLLLLVAVRRRRARAEAAPAPTRMPGAADAPTPTAIPGPARLSAAEGMPEAAPARAPLAPAPPAVAAEPLVVPQSWISEEIVREPGWLMPGEVDNVWQADAAPSAPVPAGVPAAVNGVGRANGHGAPAPGMGSLGEETIPGFDAAAGWGGAATVALDRPEPGEGPVAPQWDPVDDLPEVAAGGEPPAGPDAAAWSERAFVGWHEPAVEPDVGPDVEAWAARAEAEVVEAEPVVDAPVAAPEPLAAERPAAWPVAGWALGVPVEAPAEPAGEVDVPDASAVAWWDEADEPEAEAADPPAGSGAGTGRFALGGFALQPGHEAIAGVTFRAALPAPPTAWAVAPAGEVAPGTLVLSVDGAVNTGADEVAVLTDDGFAPSAEGFTVRAAARAAGPFAISGTFRVA